MTRDEAIALAHAVGPDGMTAPAEWVIAAILRAAGQATTPTRPEPTTSLGDLTVTMQNSGSMLFKVKGVGVGGRSVGPTTSPKVIAETLRGAADDLCPVAAKPGPSAPPWSVDSPFAVSFVACGGNLKIEAQSRSTPAGESGFDIVVNAARTDRAPERIGFRWSSDPKDAAKDLRRLADCLYPLSKVDKVTIKPGMLPDLVAFKPAEFTFSESKIDRAFAAAEWQFIASSFGLARAALKQAGYPDQQFEGAQVLASTKVDEIRRMGGKS